MRKLAVAVAALTTSEHSANRSLREIWRRAQLVEVVRKSALGVVARTPLEHCAHLCLAQLRCHKMVQLVTCWRHRGNRLAPVRLDGRGRHHWRIIEIETPIASSPPAEEVAAMSLTRRSERASTLPAMQPDTQNADSDEYRHAMISIEPMCSARDESSEPPEDGALPICRRSRKARTLPSDTAKSPLVTDFQEPEALRRRMKAVRLDRGSKKIKQTNKTEVFVKSPQSQKLQRDLRAKEKARATQDPAVLQMFGLARSISADEPQTLGVLDDREACQPRSIAVKSKHCAASGEQCEIQPVLADVATPLNPSGFGLLPGVSEHEVSSSKDEAQGSAASSSEGESEDVEDDDEGEESSDESMLSDDDILSPKALLLAGTSRRASEQTMMAHLKLLAAKQPLRYSRPQEVSSPKRPASAEPDESSLARRQQANKLATGFTELYSETVGILQDHMHLAPPNRRHSISLAELRVYRRDSFEVNV